jgi:hypothetical protein
MADRRRIVTLPSGVGSPTTVLDLENGSTYQAVKDSFVVTPGARKTTMATQPRRYAGARPVAETHENGTIEWKMLVSGATVTAAMANVEALLTQLESVTGLFLEWRPDGATSSVYYELRGSPTWKPTYSWAQMQGAGSMYIDLSFPVAPLAQLDKIVAGASRPSGGSPAYYALAPTIPGDAPALADITISPQSGQAAVWAMLAWMARPGSPASGQVVPFGVIEGEAANALTTWAVTANANMRNASFAAVTTSGSGSARAQFLIDPSTLTPDAFRTDTVDMEIWGALNYSATTLQGLTVTASFWNQTKATNPKQYTREYGSSGKSITPPAIGREIVRLGTLTLPVNLNAGWTLQIDAAWTGVSAGSVTFGLDYLLLVPARQRACSPTAKPNDSTYPAFMTSVTVGNSKTIYSNLSGGPNEPGLGGSPIELPPGLVDLIVAISTSIPDTSTESVGVNSSPTSVVVTVTPRAWLASGT